MFHYKIVVFFLVIPWFAHALEQKNPYMTPIKIDMPSCIKENKLDCLRSICIVSPSSCNVQCTANATEKCKKLAGQTQYGN